MRRKRTSYKTSGINSRRKSTYRHRKNRPSILSLILFLIGVMGIIWFLLPFIMHRILIIGNVTGLIVCAAITIYACFRKKINSILRKLWNGLIGKLLLSVAGIGIIAIIVLVVVETSCMVTAASRQPEPNATLVVLGCKVKGEKPTLILKKRLEAAYEYLTENPDSVCVLSGGQGPDEGITEAECMYRYLTERGIDEERLYKEEKSTSTRENLAFSKAIIESNQLNPHIAIATNEFHEYRAGKIAEALGLDYSAVPGSTPGYMFATYYVRELYAILYEWIL